LKWILGFLPGYQRVLFVFGGEFVAFWKNIFLKQKIYQIYSFFQRKTSRKRKK
jgi:hypothetical protein